MPHPPPQPHPLLELSLLCVQCEGGPCIACNRVSSWNPDLGWMLAEGQNFGGSGESTVLQFVGNLSSLGGVEGGGEEEEVELLGL